MRSMNSGMREVGLDQTLRGLDEGLTMLARAMEIKGIVTRAREGVFSSDGDGDERMSNDGNISSESLSIYVSLSHI